MSINKERPFGEKKLNSIINMFHEVKTPISVILGSLKLIEMNRTKGMCTNEYCTRHYPVIRQNCYKILKLITNILEIEKAGTGTMQCEPVECNISDLLREITLSVLPFAEQKKIRLEYSAVPECIIAVIDIEKIDMIVMNLLSNAIKFTNPGGFVKVGAFAGTDHIGISVKDNGIGIPESKRAEIFERYWQMKDYNANTAQNGDYGFGIGLSLVKALVDHHKGSIELHSQEGAGSEFIIKLPATACDKKNRRQSLPRKQEIDHRLIESINIEFSDIYRLDRTLS